MRLLGDVVIDVPPDSQVHRQVVRKRAEVRDIEIDPAIRLHYVEVAEPDMHNPSGDFERLQRGAHRAVGAERAHRRSCGAARPAEDAARPASGRSPWRSHRGHRVIAIWPGLRERCHGLAVDIGSTTIAAHLCDLGSGEVRRLVGPDEPADPLRRGPDEPGLLRDDESRRRPGDDRRGARGAEHAGRRGRRRPGSPPTTSWTPPSSATRSCTTCCSASIRPSSAARPFALALDSALTRPGRATSA